MSATDPKQAIAEKESRWVLLAQTGDKEALDRILVAIQVPRYRYLLRICREERLAEDLLQETLLQIYRKLKLLEDPQLFRPWAYRVASRISLKRLKKGSHEFLGNSGDLENGDVPVDAFEDHSALGDLSIDLQEGLSELPTQISAVLSLHYLDGFLLTDVAAILEVPLGTVKSRLNQGLKKLRARFHD
jgi:RNA polymerase sigma-70 factor, ECF subfamily